MNSISPKYSTFIFILRWAIAQNRLFRYGPLRRIFVSTMGHSAEYGLALWPKAQNFVKCCGPQHGICLESDTNQIPCIHIHARGCVSTCTCWAVYLHACGHVSTCMWLCINVVMYPHACRCVSTSEFGYALWAITQNPAQQCGPLRRISLSAMGHSAESGLALWATAQNFVKRYGPRCRSIDHSAESQEIH
jgi:hypothetical protein